MMYAIKCTDLTKDYGRMKALDHLSFSIQQNKLTGLIGRNGAGKTTLLKIMAGFIQSTSGDIHIFSENPFNSLKVSANMVYIDDHMSFPETLNLAEILHVAAGFYANWDSQLAHSLLRYFGLQESGYHHHLSKGMKSTFNMIYGLSSRCALTIMDEPTTGMDASVRKDFYRAILKEYLAFPRTIILSSHHLNEIEDLLEDILLIHEGKKVQHKSIEEFKQLAIGLKGRTEMVEALIGNKNLFYSQRIGVNSSYVVVENSFPEAILQEARREGVEIQPVAADDLCVYLTSSSKGGIDDVLNRG